MNHKKAELSSNYRWLIILIVLILGSLIYLNVIDTQNIQNKVIEKCEIGTGIGCSSHILESGNKGGLALTLTNDLGNDIEIQEILLLDNQDKIICKSIFKTPFIIINKKENEIKIPSSENSLDFNSQDYNLETNYCSQSSLPTSLVMKDYIIKLSYNLEGKIDYQNTVLGQLVTRVR